MLRSTRTPFGRSDRGHSRMLGSILALIVLVAFSASIRGRRESRIVGGASGISGKGQAARKTLERASVSSDFKAFGSPKLQNQPPPRSKPKLVLSRRRQLQGLVGAGVAAAATVAAGQNKADAAAATSATLNALQEGVQEGVPVVSTLREARKSLKRVGKTLRNQKKERDSYTKGASASIIATGSHSLAGLSAGAMSTIVLHPIDTIKTRLQAGAGNITKAVAEGNLYDGIISNLMKEAPNSAIYMTVVESIQNVLITVFPKAKLLALFLAGGFGDLVGSICRVPAEMLNKRLQTGMSPNIIDACKATFLTPEGRKLTKETWGIVVMRDVPHGAVQYMIFLGAHAPLAALVAALPVVPDDLVPFLSDAIPGALAGAVAAYVTTPADVMVTNFATYQKGSGEKQDVSSEMAEIQADTNEISPGEAGAAMSGGGESIGAAAIPLEAQGQADAGDEGRPTFAGVGKKVLDKEGWQGFLVGGIQRIFYYGPMTGVFFGLYETLDRTLYPKLLPALTNPILYEFPPKVANAFGSAEQKLVEVSIGALNAIEHVMTSGFH